MHLSHHAITRSRYRALMISLHCHLSAFFRLPPSAFCFLAAAKGDGPAPWVSPVVEMLKAGLSGQLGTVELCGAAIRGGRSPARRRSSRSRETTALALLDAEKLAAEAVRQDQGGMGAPAVFPHPCEDVTRRVHGASRAGALIRSVRPPSVRAT